MGKVKNAFHDEICEAEEINDYIKPKSPLHKIQCAETWHSNIENAIATRIWEATRGADTQDRFESITKEALNEIMGNWGDDGIVFYQI